MCGTMRYVVIIVAAAASAVLAVVIAKSLEFENTAMIGGAAGGIVAGIVASLCLRGGSCGGTKPH